MCPFSFPPRQGAANIGRRRTLHEEVGNEIREMIQKAEFKDGRLPSEADLSRQLDVSRATLREALLSLEAEGLIVRQHGVGTFVQDHLARVQAGIERLESFVDTVRRSGFTPRVEHLTVEERPLSKTAAKALGLQPGIPSVYVDNLYYANDIPAVYSPTEIPAHLFGDMAEFAAGRDRWNSARQYMDHLGIKVTSVTLSVYAVSATSEMAQRLRVTRGHPLLLLEGPSFTAKGEAVNWTRAYFNTSIYHFVLVRR